MKEIIELYKESYPFSFFYSRALNKFKMNKVIENFPIDLDSYELGLSKSQYEESEICAHFGDIRIDLPIWFGNPKAKKRIALVGLEPRHTNNKFNLEKKESFKVNIYGTPFGIEAWNEKDKYYTSFKSVILDPDTFCYFTDVVKEYEVEESKKDGDTKARYSFLPKARNEQNMAFLSKELTLLNPTHLVGLGNKSFEFLSKNFGTVYNVIKVRHPSYGGQELARQQLSNLLTII